MRHFVELLERQNDYQSEYEKLEELCNAVYTFRDFLNNRNYSCSICDCIENNFMKWQKRRNYCSLSELREQLGFQIEYRDKGTYLVNATDVDLAKYIVFSEMIITLTTDLQHLFPAVIRNCVLEVIDTIRATVDNAGLDIRFNDEGVMIVNQNAVAVKVAEHNPEIADVVIEYNGYLLKGNLERKKELLRKIADILESKKHILNQVCKGIGDDFFAMANTMNIRHNNCAASDKKKYNPIFAKLGDAEKEKWYDVVYEQGLAIFVALNQQERNGLIAEYKQKMAKRKGSK